jgi:hypothetical protein
VDELSDPAPTERRGEVLPADHPATNLAPPEGDCPAHIPAEVKERTAATHGNREPPDTPIRPEELM